jgi:hypothetical protein
MIMLKIGPFLPRKETIMFVFLFAPHIAFLAAINSSWTLNVTWMNALGSLFDDTPKYLDSEKRVLNIDYPKRHQHRTKAWHPELAPVITLQQRAA